MKKPEKSIQGRAPDLADPVDFDRVDRTRKETSDRVMDFFNRIVQIMLILRDEYAEELQKAEDEGESMSAFVAKFLWNLLEEDEKNGAVLVDGVLGTVFHRWFEIPLRPRETQYPDTRIIIDPSCPDVQPPALLIAGSSPLAVLYKRGGQ